MQRLKPMERTLRAVHRLSTAGLFGLAVGMASVAWAGMPRESVMRVPVLTGIEQAYIDVTIFKPEGAGPFPVVVLSHGSPRNAEARKREGRQRLAAQSKQFVKMGFAVVVPTRRGYGDSEGKWAEAYGPCSNPDYYRAGLESARDVRAAIDAIRAEPWADGDRIVLAGQSAGGFGSVAASSLAIRGVVAVVNFAGGRGSLSPDNVCGESRLVDAMSRYGAAARVPELWIYSVNDHFFRPDLARRMHDAFVRAGGAAEFVEAPAYGLDGHGYFARAMEDWVPRVAGFLHRVGAAR
jgi:dienelactone hydrolase